MATLLIPTTPSLPFQIVKIQLEGRLFALHLNWNQREARWYLEIHDNEDTLLLSGIKLVTNWQLLARRRAGNLDLPPGELAVTDLSADGSPPGLDELGVGLRCELTYFESTP